MKQLEINEACQSDGAALAEIRALAMKDSLEALGRYDEQRVRQRFLDRFDPTNTYKLIASGEVIGFYMLTPDTRGAHLDDLYVLPKYQGMGAGSRVIAELKTTADKAKTRITLGALRGSPSNDFYQRHGFIKTHEDEFDIYYQYCGA
ncbi:MAG: GNAT family N-acetyltransferase [Gammaproteobacteria bacterium]|nr:GNAT family N-acetyltransferase [Gammaproteobacteria bacterium]